MRYFLTFVLLGLLVSTYAFDYEPTDAYSIKFSTAKAEGTFRGLQGTIDFDPKNPEAANFDVYVDAATINTGNSAKDKHARGDSWFDVENHPRIVFQSQSVAKTDTGYLLDGQLTIKGVAKSVHLPFSFADNIFSGTVTIDRQDFGISGPFLFGGLVGDEVTVELRIPVK